MIRRLALVYGLAILPACGPAATAAAPARSPASTTAPAAATPAAASAATPAPAAVPSGDLVPFSSDESMRRLARSRHAVDFYALANQFEGQQNGAMCGPTTAVIVLNTLTTGDPDATRPQDQSLFPAEYRKGLPPGWDPVFHRYTQRLFLEDPRVQAVKTRDTFYGRPGPDGMRDGGWQLRQLGRALTALGLDVSVHVMTDAVTDDAARRDLVANLSRRGDYVIVNYSRPALGQKGGGHISPLGAYDQASDSFLVLDVNPNQGKTWAWVPARRLLSAMRTFDTVENRGYLLVRKRPSGE